MAQHKFYNADSTTSRELKSGYDSIPLKTKKAFSSLLPPLSLIHRQDGFEYKLLMEKAFSMLFSSFFRLEYAHTIHDDVRLYRLGI